MNSRLVLALLLVGLGLGTFGTELTTGLALAFAVLVGERRRLAELGGPVLVLALAFALSAPLGGPGAWLEVLGRAWPLAPLLAVPCLARARDPRVELAGLVAACLPAAWGVGQRLLGQDGSGPWSHHLTLGYALIPPLAVATHRGRWPVAAVLLAGVGSTGGSGPLLAAGVVLLATRLLAPVLALGAGLALAMAAIGAGAWQGRADVAERAVLWASGALLGLGHPLGIGTGGFRDAAAAVQDDIAPGFHFPLHAHDSALQLGALVGLGGWIALLWLGVELWRRGDRAGRAALAALAVGSLTQDVLGDMEVARTAAAWLAWCALPGIGGGDGDPGGDGDGGGEPPAREAV